MTKTMRWLIWLSSLLREAHWAQRGSRLCGGNVTPEEQHQSDRLAPEAMFLSSLHLHIPSWLMLVFNRIHLIIYHLRLVQFSFCSWVFLNTTSSSLVGPLLVYTLHTPLLKQCSKNGMFFHGDWVIFNDWIISTWPE